MQHRKPTTYTTTHTDWDTHRQTTPHTPFGCQTLGKHSKMDMARAQPPRGFFFYWYLLKLKKKINNFLHYAAGWGCTTFFSIFGFSVDWHSAMLKNSCSPIKIVIMWWGCCVGCLCCEVFQFLWFLGPLLINTRKLDKKA